MGQTTGIEWTHHTFNPWIGCSKVAPECAHCYAEAMSTRFKKAAWGTHGTRVVTSEANWSQPVKWNKAAEKAGERRRVFCASMADVFEDWGGPMLTPTGVELWTRDGVEWADEPVGPHCIDAASRRWRRATMDDVRRRLFALIDSTPWLDWLLLTKRPENIHRMWPKGSIINGDDVVWSKPNVWLGTSAGTQESADRFIPELLKCRDLAQFLFVSCEPMLDAVDFTHALNNGECGSSACTKGKVDWLIVGCESSGSRVGRLGEFANEAAWWSHAEKMADQCEASGVAYFFKQGPQSGRIVHTAYGWPQEFPLTQGVEA